MKKKVQSLLCARNGMWYVDNQDQALVTDLQVTATALYPVYS